MPFGRSPARGLTFSLVKPASTLTLAKAGKNLLQVGNGAPQVAQGSTPSGKSSRW
ncbi:MAG: hypothetical protein HRT46_01420 [Deltaproteobacteria bacterium]|nr:hypothetical protein [Deltaproteobacteria bacterium]